MFENLIHWDRTLFIYLNSLGSITYDQLWLEITDKLNWIPLFILLIYLLFKKLGWKNAVLALLFLGLLGLITDQVCNLFKNGFARLRPNNDPDLIGVIRILRSPQSFSFISGHAANSTAITTFLVLALIKHVKQIRLLYIWPLLFAYSRIYLGLHFPLDIICGYAWGVTSGWMHYKGYDWVRKKYLL